MTVSHDGSVEKARVISGHPSLYAGVEQIVRNWKFEPQSDGQRTFELMCDFELPDMTIGDTVEVAGPSHLVLMAPLPLADPSEA